jgi:hypothetical protein
MARAVALLVGRHFSEIKSELSSSPKVSHQPLHGIAIIQIENRSILSRKIASNIRFQHKMIYFSGLALGDRNLFYAPIFVSECEVRAKAENEAIL